MNRGINDCGRWFLAVGFGFAGALGIAPVPAQELCGGVGYPFPYTDVSSVGAAFCPGIMEAYVTGISKGTTPTTFSPNETVTRVQMTTFLQRSLDQGVARASRRAALNQWWVPQNTTSMQTISVGGTPFTCAADGDYVWVPTNTGNEVIQVQASTGKVFGTWTGAIEATGALVAAGKVFVAGGATPGSLYVIDPTQSPGAVTTATSSLGGFPSDIAFDGTNLWTANNAGSVSIISLPSYTVNTVTTGFTDPNGILYDGTNIWVTDYSAGTLLQLNANGTVVLTVAVGSGPGLPAFDGINIWVPNFAGNSITVVQASTGNVVATITADASNLLDSPFAARFDGERILVTNRRGDSVTVFKAADLSLIANVPVGSSTQPVGGCSDGINFWVDLLGKGDLLRF